MVRRNLLLASALAFLFAAAPPALARQPAAHPAARAPRAHPLSDAVKAKRPSGGEYFGLYLMGKKVGYVFTDLHLLEGDPTKAESINEFVFKANVGNAVSERRHREVRTYEARPNGRLLSFVIQQSGDGGDQTLEGTNAPGGLHVVRRRPGMPNDVRNYPASKETIESADQARVALLRGKKVTGTALDGSDLDDYEVTSTPEKPETRLMGGVKVRLQRVSTWNAKEKVPTTATYRPDGAGVDLTLGDTMRAVAEPKEIAQRLDKVEVFGLTRVVLPHLIADARRQIPGKVTFVVKGLPARFAQDTFRQHYAKQGDLTAITISAALPDKAARKGRPLADPTGGQYLKATLAVESDDAQIRALAKKIVGGEKDAWQAAQKINRWVFANLEKDYGASADRATDVLRQMKGDCTEHALLTTALLRAAGIPAKRMDGLVYLVNGDGVPALYWHEWVEAWVGTWTDLDPTFGQPVADATHLALGEEGSAEITPLIGSLKVVDVR